MLPINEIFTSIDGEINHFHQGRISTFIRVYGCNQIPNCTYCDTKKAVSGDDYVNMHVEDIVKEIEKIGTTKVTITGGEPLLYRKEVSELLEKLSCEVSIETNGTIYIKGVKNWRLCDSWIIDCKGPSSGVKEVDIDWRNFSLLNKEDWVKHIICNSTDYEFAKKVVKSYPDINHAFSPVFPSISLSVNDLLHEMIRDKLFDVVLNIQIHKLLNLK